MLSLSRIAIHQPRKVLVLAAVAVCVLTPGVVRLKLRTDGQALLPSKARDVLYDRVIRHQFGLSDSLIVLIRRDAPGGIFDAGTLRRVVELTQRLQEMEGLKPSDVISLATEKGHRVRQGTLSFLGLLDPLPQTPAELKQLREDIQSLRIYNGTLVSANEKATAIYIEVPERIDRLAFCARVQRILDGFGGDAEGMYLTGAPVAESLLGIHILEDLGAPISLLGDDFAWSSDEVRGRPGSLDQLRFWVARHLGLLPLAIAVMTVVFSLAFRSLTAMAFTWVKIVCCLGMVFGLMGWCGVPVYLTTAVIPVILVAIGVSDEVHIFNRYARNLRNSNQVETPDLHLDDRAFARNAMLAAMTEVWRPVAMTSITTAFGFLSFVLSTLPSVQAFGIFTAIGALICMMWALTATPALAMMVHPRRFARVSKRLSDVATRPAEARVPSRKGVLATFGRAAISARLLVLSIFAALLVIAVFGIRRIAIQDSWIDGFSPSTRFYQTTQYFNEQFLGMHALYVCVDTGGHALEGMLDQSRVDHQSLTLSGDAVPDSPKLVGQSIELRRTTPPATTRAANVIPYQSWITSAEPEGDSIKLGLERRKGSPRFRLYLGDKDKVAFLIAPRRLAQPETLRIIRDFERFLAAHPDEQVGGALGPTAYLETTNFIAQGRRYGSHTIPDSADSVEFLWKSYGSIRGEDRLRCAVDPERARAIISVFLKNANFRDTRRFLDDVRRYQRERLANQGIEVSFAGDVAASQAMISAITGTQVSSIALSILGVFISAVVVHRSLKWGMLCALPCALATPLTFGLMGFANIPLGVATSMFAAMAIGIGDDYAIHFVERYRLALAHGASRVDGIIESLTAAGPSIIVDALSVSLGFVVLTLSQVPANARLGMMIVASIVTCLAATLLLLPAICALMRAGPRTGIQS